ncbi:hypothetical protein NUW54_g2207 [Trametes sanguinea]|uniref:Uncharacterized protein n=1 Tax=Trametes sanguinea TaxID=158606 RepID=A0ACC1Q6J3_9APHY|nr:hypothetical protein NUW54_g2207 [Trametes sanguinea]
MRTREQPIAVNLPEDLSSECPCIPSSSSAQSKRTCESGMSCGCLGNLLKRAGPPRPSPPRTKRPVISKPTLIMTSEARVGNALARGSIEGLPVTTNSFPDLPMFDPTHYAPSGLTSLVDSPSSSTDARSVPRRRADFAPPRLVTTPPEAHVPGDRRSRKSLASSFETSSSSRTHEAEAVIQRATRATSVRSTVSAVSFGSVPASQAESGRPRLVPFTSAARVPVPKLPTSFFSPDLSTPAESSSASGPKRAGRDGRPPTDELKTGIEYVRALGDDHHSLVGPSPVASFSSIESSHQGHDAGPASAARVRACSPASVSGSGTASRRPRRCQDGGQPRGPPRLGQAAIAQHTEKLMRVSPRPAHQCLRRRSGLSHTLDMDTPHPSVQPRHRLDLPLRFEPLNQRTAICPA